MKKFFLIITTIVLFATATYAYSLSSRAKSVLRSAGYTIKGSKSGYLSQGEYTYRTVYLYSGIDYVILGVGNIRDLDTTLYDENWGLIDSDHTSDSSSQVNVTPKWDGTFYIKVKAYSGSGSYSQIIGWK